MLNSLSTVFVVVQVISSIAIIGLVLLQHGKGADMGASFGSGASGSLFGATGSSSFLSKSTAIAVALFFISTLALAYSSSNRTVSAGVLDKLPVGAAVSASVPAVGGVAASAAAEKTATSATSATEIAK